VSKEANEMQDENKTEEQFMNELAESRQGLAELEQLLTDEKSAKQAMREAREYAESIVATVREPLLVLDADLRVVSTSRSFDLTFGVKPEETKGRFIYDLGNQQWDIPRLRELLGEILPKNTSFYDFEVDHKFPYLGHRVMILNAKRIYSKTKKTRLILLAIQDVTETKRAQERLFVSESRYRRLFETAQDGILILNADTGRIDDVNPFLIDMLGYSKEELMGKRLWEIGPFKDIKASKEAFQELQDKGYVRYEDLPLETKNKQQVSVEFISNVYSINGDRVIQCNIRNVTERVQAEEELRDYKDHLEKIVEERTTELAKVNRKLREDITKRKRVEKALRQSEERYRELFVLAPDAIFTIDTKGRIVEANPAALNLTGFSKDELADKDFSMLPSIRSEDIPNYEKVLDSLLKGKPPEPFEAAFYTKDGQQHWGEVQVGLIKTMGKITGVQAITRDISARKEAEKKIRDSERKYKMLVENIPQKIFFKDKDSVYVSCNRNYARDLKIEDEEILGRTDYDFYPKKLADKYRADDRRVIESGQMESIEERYVQDGQDMIVQTLKSPVKNEEGEVVGVLGVFYDITERKRWEAERKEIEQKAQLASRLSTVGEMASGIAHEINNPLTSVIGFSQLLMQKDVPGDVKEYARIISDGAERVASIVKGLLTFARQQKPERVCADINQIIKTTLQLRAYEMETGNIEVVTQFDPDLPCTTADAGQLQQVFLNIIINAETEMSLAHGKGKLLVKTEAADNTIRISFKDNGPGIAPESLERIFDPFFTTREAGQGTGLGLSICHGIISEHKGRLYAESKLGKGATFIVELPIIAEEKQLGLAEPATDESDKVTGAKVLVVDDELATLQLLSQILSGEGYEVKTVDNATDALERIKGERYSLILLDIKMPGMNGMELYMNIQKLARSLARRVVFITGDAIATVTRDFLSRTKVPYITKPFDAERLKNDIKQILTEAT
jgi:PAS domain S-box-containing protein